jgi:asparagine synthetase B (glutamine-hydrolysing)
MTTWDGVTGQEGSPLDEKGWQRLTSNAVNNVINMRLSLPAGELNIAVPLATPEQIYYAGDPQGYFVSNDMRLLMRWVGLRLDERAVYALFQYGAIPPPLTISKNIKRIPNGHVCKLSPKSPTPLVRLECQLTDESEEKRGPSNPENQVLRVLDNKLAQVPEGSQLYFSGGVDSGLMAARLAKMGRTDVRLVNYSFGPRDQEAHLALQMADYLGFDLEQILYEPSDVESVLQRLGKDYSFPFGDDSVIPSNLLVYGALRRAGSPPCVVDGTGADGAFAVGLEYARWRWIYSLPLWCRQVIGEGYKRLGLWRNDCFVASFGRALRRSGQMPLQDAAITAQNALDGIAYNIPPETRNELEEIFSTHVEVIAAELEPPERLSLLDLVHLCAGRMAAKYFDPLRRHGIKSLFPFLEPPMLRLTSSLRLYQKSERGEAKALLKRLLERHVPVECVRRPKSGFEPPFAEILTYDSVKQLLEDVVLSESNPLIDYCNSTVLEQIVDRAQRGMVLGQGVRRFLWTLMFTSAWLPQVEL